MTLPTREEVKEYVDKLFAGVCLDTQIRDYMAYAIKDYTKWLKEREVEEKEETCSHCNGTGKIEDTVSNNIDGNVHTRACYNCNGKGKIMKLIIEDVKLGGRHHVCSICGQTVFGSSLHHCSKKSDIGKATSEQNPTLGIADKIEEHTKKTMKDISNLEAVEKAKKFTEMIKDGTIKNRHTTLYANMGKCDKCMYNPHSCKGYNYMDSMECAYFEEKEAKEEVSDPIGDLMWKGEIKMDKPKLTEIQFKQLQSDCCLSSCPNSLIYAKRSGWVIEDKEENLPELEIGDKVVIKPTNVECIISELPNSEGKYKVSFDPSWCGYYARDLIELKESKTKEPLIVHNVMSYKGKNYLAFKVEAIRCSFCKLDGTMTDGSCSEFYNVKMGVFGKNLMMLI